MQSKPINFVFVLLIATFHSAYATTQDGSLEDGYGLISLNKFNEWEEITSVRLEELKAAHNVGMIRNDTGIRHLLDIKLKNTAECKFRELTYKSGEDGYRWDLFRLNFEVSNVRNQFMKYSNDDFLRLGVIPQVSDTKASSTKLIKAGASTYTRFKGWEHRYRHEFNGERGGKVIAETWTISMPFASNPSATRRFLVAECSLNGTLEAVDAVERLLTGLDFDGDISKQNADSEKKEVGKKRSELNLANSEVNQTVNAGIQQDKFNEYYVLAGKGDANAQNKVALSYVNGNGVAKDLAKAFTWFEKAANQNHPEAQFYYAKFILNGQFTEKSPEKALLWFKKSAEQGYADAQNALGTLYMIGLGTKVDYVEASKWLKKSAVAGNAEGMYNLAQLYEKGKGLDQDSHQAIYWYEQSASKGFAFSEFELGVAHAHGLGGYKKNETKAMEWYEKAAKKGISVAQANLAEIYLARKNQDYKNIYQAVSWFKKAAEQGLPRSQMMLGLAYLNGEGISRDKPLGLEWLIKSSNNGYEPAKAALVDIRKAHENKTETLANEYRGKISTWPEIVVAQLERSAIKGDATAQENLAIAHQFGLLRIPKNPSIAADWYLKSIGSNVTKYNFAVHRNLGLIYMQGTDQVLQKQESDLSKIKLNIDQLAEQGDMAAIKFLARFYYNLGDGYVSLNKAKYWYEKAANTGDLGSQLALARLYTFSAPNEEGADAKPDYVKAVHWYKKVVIHDLPYAQYELAKLYLNRHISIGNNQEAMNLLKMAADKNILNAKLDLANAYKEGVITTQNYALAMEHFQKLATLTYPSEIFREDIFYSSAMSVADIYENGLGVPVSKVNAYAWLNLVLERLDRKLLSTDKLKGSVSMGNSYMGGGYLSTHNPEVDSPTGFSLGIGTDSPKVKENEVKNRLSLLHKSMTPDEVKLAKEILNQLKNGSFKVTNHYNQVVNQRERGV